jgi:hypothetical protein
MDEVMMATTDKTIKSRAKRRSLSAPASSKKEMLYDKDFVKWTRIQADFLKEGNFAKLDVNNLIEEIESLGKKDKRSLRSHLTVLLIHLLKKNFQPHGKGNSKSWDSSILNATREIKFLIEDSPSLKNELLKIFANAYEDARRDAAIETQLDIMTFPAKCPWEIQKILPFISDK